MRATIWFSQLNLVLTIEFSQSSLASPSEPLAIQQIFDPLCDGILRAARRLAAVFVERVSRLFNHMAFSYLFNHMAFSPPFSFFFLNHMASVCVYWKNRIACKTPPFGHTVLSRESCSELEPCERFRAPCHVFDILATAFCGLLTVSLRFLYSAFLAVCMSVSWRTSVAFVTRWLLLSPRG